MTTVNRTPQGFLIPWAKPPIPHAEMIVHIRAFQNGDEAAFEAIATHNGGFIRQCLLELYPGASYDQKNDLIHEGLLGLMEAATRYDETKGYKFISYAVWWIKQKMRQHLDDMGRPYRRPNNAASQSVLTKTEDRLYQELERPPSAEELSEALRAKEAIVRNVETVEALRVDRKATLLLSRPPSLGQGVPAYNRETPLQHILKDPDPPPSIEELLMAEDQQIMATRLLSLLTDDRQKRILRLYFGLDGEAAMTLEAIGESMAITRERVRQLKERAFSIIRGRLKTLEMEV